MVCNETQILTFKVTAKRTNIANMGAERRFDYDGYLTAAKKRLERGMFRLTATGFSYENRPIDVLTIGSGRVNVLAWSQMHGNEPTSTMALLDAMDYLESGAEDAAVIRSKLTLTVIPLLNPDGYSRYDRRNAQGIDINRDARLLVSPEARLLMDTWKITKPTFALNLHDQETRYVSFNPPQETLLAMLAPECDELKTVTETRRRAMKVIAGVASEIGSGRVARYDDVYTPTAFGDTFMRSGTSSILIESGTTPGDKLRSLSRAAMSKAILAALMIIASGGYESIDEAEYDRLPLNLDLNGYELIVKNLTVKSPRGDYKTDIAVGRVKPTCNVEDFIDDFDDYRVKGIGDLGNAVALRTVDMDGSVFNGGHEDIFIGRSADFGMTRPDGTITNISELLIKRY